MCGENIPVMPRGAMVRGRGAAARRAGGRGQQCVILLERRGHITGAERPMVEEFPPPPPSRARLLLVNPSSRVLHG
jgi:hypothetical protein